MDIPSAPIGARTRRLLSTFSGVRRYLINHYQSRHFSDSIRQCAASHLDAATPGSITRDQVETLGLLASPGFRVRELRKVHNPEWGSTYLRVTGEAEDGRKVHLSASIDPGAHPVTGHRFETQKLSVGIVSAPGEQKRFKLICPIGAGNEYPLMRCVEDLARQLDDGTLSSIEWCEMPDLPMEDWSHLFRIAGIDDDLRPEDNLFKIGVECNNAELTLKALEAGANPNLKDDETDLYPLQIAIQRKQHDLAEKLIECGAMPSLIDQDVYMAFAQKTLDREAVKSRLANARSKHRAGAEMSM